jgi:hypothetical protein
LILVFREQRRNPENLVPSTEMEETGEDRKPSSFTGKLSHIMLCPRPLSYLPLE